MKYFIFKTFFLISYFWSSVNGFALEGSKGKVDQNSEVCLTPECVITAGRMLSSMDTSVNPCDDFYTFSCGGWIKDHPIPDTSSSWGQFDILGEKLIRNLKHILERKNDSPSKPVKMAKDFYWACFNQTLNEDQNNQEKLKLIAQQLIDPKASFSKNLGHIRRKISGNFLFSLYIDLDMKNASKNIIYIDQPGFGIDRAFLLSDSELIRNAYKNLISRFWTEIFKSDAESEKIAQSILDFEIKLANASTSPENRRDSNKLYNPMAIPAVEDLTNEFEALNWKEYLNETFSEALPNYNFENENLIVADTEYFKKIGKLLKSTESDTLDNYLLWRIILSLGGQASIKLRDIEFEYVKEISGRQFPNPRWKICTARANGDFGMALSSIYVEEFFKEDSKQKVEDMVKDIQEAFYDILDESDWIKDQKTKDVAKEKARKMLKNLGYPDWIKNETKLEEFYDGLELSNPQNNFDNYLDILKYGGLKEIQNLPKPRDLSQWIMDPTMVNAAYMPTHNSITFPAGILNPPFFGMPLASLNYGGIGAVIGHEQSHGFDDQGRQYNSEGDLVDWWPTEVVEEFKSKAQCFIDQYGNYFDSDTNITLNGVNTLGENIADNGGLSQAFSGYQKYVERNGREITLPGMNYSSDQLFFLSFSQLWCGSFTPQSLQNYIRTNVHSPMKYRVKGSIANSVEFAKVWKCPAPQNPCKIW